MSGKASWHVTVATLGFSLTHGWHLSGWGLLTLARGLRACVCMYVYACACMCMRACTPAHVPVCVHAGSRVQLNFPSASIVVRCPVACGGEARGAVQHRGRHGTHRRQDLRGHHEYAGQQRAGVLQGLSADLCFYPFFSCLHWYMVFLKDFFFKLLLLY